MQEFSVIIPVYNIEHYIEACVHSVQNQPYENWEILLIDDGSTDGSGTLCDRLASEDKRIRVFHQENAGLSGARNTGIINAQKKWVIFLDGDDFWAPDILYRISERIMENPTLDVFMGRYYIYSVARGTITLPSDKNFRAGLFHSPTCKGAFDRLNESYEYSYWSIWKCVVRRSFIVKHGLYFQTELRCMEDVPWILSLLSVCSKIYYMDIPFVIYRESRPGSLSQSSLRQMRAILWLYRNCENGHLSLLANSHSMDIIANSFFTTYVLSAQCTGDFSKERDKLIRENRDVLNRARPEKKQRYINTIRKLFGHHFALACARTYYYFTGY